MVGKGMAAVRHLPRSIEAGLLEAVIGALCQDGGLEPAETFILQAFANWLDTIETNGPQGNYKSMLQQYSQEHYGVTPVYVLLDEKGPDHNKCFESEVVLRERHFHSAWGVTKKEAEQRAAHNALVELGVVEQTQSD
jgi:ribonuclease-3